MWRADGGGTVYLGVCWGYRERTLSWFLRGPLGGPLAGHLSICTKRRQCLDFVELWRFPDSQTRQDKHYLLATKQWLWMPTHVRVGKILQVYCGILAISLSLICDEVPFLLPSKIGERIPLKVYLT